MRRILFAAAVPILSLAAALSPSAAQAEPPSGVWREQGSQVVLRFQPCGAATCGVLEASARLDADPNLRDDKNPDPALRSRPLKGVAMLEALAPAGEGWTGRAYFPSTGRIYPVTVRRTGPDTLTATGCIAPLLCHTTTLLRAR